MQTATGPGTPCKNPCFLSRLSRRLTTKESVPQEIINAISKECRNILTSSESFRVSRSHPRFHAAANPSRLTVLPASRAQALLSAPLDPDANQSRERRHIVAFHQLHLLHRRVRAFSVVMSSLPGARGQPAYTFQGITQAEVCLPPSGAQRNMLADALQHLTLFRLVVSVLETDAPILLNFIERLHRQRRPPLASVQLNVFLPKNNPASESNMEEEDDGDNDDGDEEEGDVDDGDEAEDGDVDNEDEAEEGDVDDDDDEGEEGDVDDDDDDDEFFEPAGNLAFWTDPIWKDCLGHLSQMKSFGLWTQKGLQTEVGDLQRVMPADVRQVTIHYTHQHFGLGTMIVGFRLEVYERLIGVGRTPTWRQVSRAST